MLSGLDELSDWPDKVKTMQNNWIGKSVGCEIKFEIYDKNKKKLGHSFRDIYNKTRYHFGATFAAISPNHPLSEKLSEQKNEIKILF